MKEGNKFGAHRVVEPQGVLPQPAWKIDNTMEIYDNEILIDVDTLNIDAASFTQIEEAEGGDVQKMAKHSLGIIAERGKHHNPDTGSGGMLLGTVAAIGPKLEDRDLKVGDRIATLVSLSLTPLKVDEVISVNKDTCQVKVKAQAILFETGIYAKMPADMDEAAGAGHPRRRRRPGPGRQAEQARPDRVHHRRRRQERPALRLRGQEARQADRQGDLPRARRRRQEAPREVRVSPTSSSRARRPTSSSSTKRSRRPPTARWPT